MNKAKTIIIFLTIILIFLFLANLVVYKALRFAFNITGLSALLLSILTFCALSFVISLLLGIRYYNFFTKIYSTFAMIWMGFFAYLFLASVLYILEFIWIGDSSRMFAYTLYGVAFFTTLYGIAHARKLKIKEVVIKLDNLPTEWQDKKAVWISDLHIGQIHGKKFTERVIKKIQTTSADIVFVGGDLFDGSSVKGILEKIEPFSHFKSPMGIYFITGNHEGYANINLFLQKIKEVGINILQNEKTIIKGMQIIGVNYIGTTKEEEFKKVLDELYIDRDIPSILLKHEPNHILTAKEAGINLQISGHTHKAQQWPFEYLARLVYGRFTYGLQQFDSLQTYTSSGTGTWGPPVRVGTDAEIVVFKFKNKN